MVGLVFTEEQSINAENSPKPTDRYSEWSGIDWLDY